MSTVAGGGVPASPPGPRLNAPPGVASMPAMPPLAALAALALALAAAVAARLLRKVRALEQELASVSERVDELSARLEVAEQDAAAALAQAEVAESVLLDKGVADEDDL